MLLVFLVVAAAHSGADVRAASATEAPATAVVRIVRAAEIRADRLEATEDSVKRFTKVRESDGTVRDATLIEFY